MNFLLSCAACASPYTVAEEAWEKPTPVREDTRGVRQPCSGGAGSPCNTETSQAESTREAGNEDSTCRLLDEYHVGNPIPGVWVVRELARSCSPEWTLLAEKASKARAARASVCPKHQGILSRITLGLDEPIEDLLAVANVNVT
jgi:hypothetical protein